MIRSLKNSIRKFIGLRNETDFYSQAGEDAITLSTFSNLLNIRKGFYVDIGAYDPYRHSNTYLLHKAGWKGMNIDPRPGSKALFDKARPNDVNIEAGIADQEGRMLYYYLGENSTMNTFSKENLERLSLLSEVKKTMEIPVYTFTGVMKKYAPDASIDYLNIDAEGFELQILSGLDFSLYSPKLISIEQNNVFTLQDVLISEVCRFMSSKGYVALAKNVILHDVATVFYIRK